MAAFLTPLVVYIPAFYAGEMGLGLATVGIIFLLTKLWDIISDPIVGLIAERFGPADGRWRFWLLISLPLMLLGVYKIFLPPTEVSWNYFASWMVLLYVGWSFLTISHISWGVEVSNDYHERARIAAYRQFAALIGALVTISIPALSDQITGASESARIHVIGVFVMVSLPILMMVTVWVTPTRQSQIDANHDYRWHDAFAILMRNRDLRALLVGNVGVLLGIAAMASVVLFYVESVLRLEQWASFAVVPLLCSGLLFLPFLKHLSRRVGKHQTFRLVLLFQILVQPLFLIIPPESLGLTVLCFMVLGAINGTAIFLPQAMIADLKDVETGTGAGRTGIYVALLQSTSKVASALAVAMMFLVLPMTGFDPAPNAVNDAGSLLGLRYMIAGLPMACFALGLMAMRNYKLERTVPASIRI